MGNWARKSQRAQIFRPAQRLGEIALQQGGETIGEGGAIVHQAATMFVEQRQLARLNIVGHPGTKALGMLAQELQQQLGIDRIIFAAAGVKGFAVIRQRLGRNGIKPEKFVVHQGIKQRAARLFQGDGDGAVGVTAAQLGDPGLQGLRFLLYHQVLDLRGAGRLQADIVLLIRPVQADPGDDGVGQRSGMIHGKSSGKRWKNTRARNLHSPYSKVLMGRHLSMRCRSERTAPLETLRAIVEQSGTPIRSGACPSASLLPLSG